MMQAPQKINTLSEANIESDLIDLGVLLGTIWRGKWLIIVATVLAVSLGGYYAYRMATPMYRSTAVVLLETKQPNVVNFDSVVSGLSGDTPSLNTEVEVMRSRGLLKKVSKKLNLVSDPEFNKRLQTPNPMTRLKSAIKRILRGQIVSNLTAAELEAAIQNEVVDSLLRTLEIRNIPNTLVFQITAETISAQKSALIADTVADLYIKNQVEVKFETTEKATSWLTGRVAELKLELEAAEAKMAAFNADTDLISVEALQALERQIKELRERRDMAQIAVTAATERLAALEAVQSGSREDKAAVADDPQLAQLLTQFQGASDPTIAEAFDARFRQILAGINLEVSRAQSQVGALQNSITRQDIQRTQQNQDLITLQQLTREAEASRLLYEYFLSRLKETSAQEGIQQADSRILSNGVIPQGPSAPKKSLILAMSGILGLMLGGGLVLVLEMRQNTYRTARELERGTGYTVMGQIPLLPTKRRKDALTYLAEKPTSAAAEAVRNLRTSVMLSNVDNPPKVIMSTSCVPGEGKTTVSLTMAQNMVGLGKKVLLIEGDIRRRVFVQYLDTGQKQGLMSVLSGEQKIEDVVVRDGRVGADILIGEQTNTNAADVFASQRFKDFIDDMRHRYDAIVIDTPPVLVVPDARVIAESVDTILFTIKWDSTSKSQVEEALRLFESVGHRVSGLVLNQISPQGMKRYGYGGKYGAYSSYGKKYYTN